MGLPALLDNYLFVGPLIVARLAEATSLPVDLIETAEQLTRADQRSKVIGVMWAGDRVAENESGRAGAAASQMVRQRWLAVLMLNNLGQQRDARQAAAGATLSQIHKALAGFAPEGAGLRTLQRAQASLAPTLTETRALYPLGFEITLAL